MNIEQEKYYRIRFNSPEGPPTIRYVKYAGMFFSTEMYAVFTDLDVNSQFYLLPSQIVEIEEMDENKAAYLIARCELRRHQSIIDDIRMKCPHFNRNKIGEGKYTCDLCESSVDGDVPF